MLNINELIDKENDLNIELERCDTHVKYLKYRVKEMIETNLLSVGLAKKAHYFEHLFTYYHQDLIPALEETVKLGQKHIELSQKNPDKSFKPVKLEMKNQFKLMRQFFNRFRQVEQEFEAFDKSTLRHLNAEAHQINTSSNENA